MRSPGPLKVNAPAEDHFADPQVSGAERRRETRHATSLEATLELANGGQVSALLTDVSLHGCAVRADTGLLRLGSFVCIGMGAESKAIAVVRWARGNTAGMEFLRQVPADLNWQAFAENGRQG